MMDKLWMIILDAVRHAQEGLDAAFAPLHVMGPVITITVIAVLTATAVKFFRKFKTRRYRKLEKEFSYWYNLKQEAIRVKDADPEKSKKLGQNIDKAKLNKVYYDYFLEGFLNSLLTTYIPILLMLGYVNATYQPEGLESIFGRKYLFIIHWFNGKQYEVGAVFWFVLCIFKFYIISFIIKLILRRKNARLGPADNEISPGKEQV